VGEASVGVDGNGDAEVGEDGGGNGSGSPSHATRKSSSVAAIMRFFMR
jgi:hypothetical protein